MADDTVAIREHRFLKPNSLVLYVDDNGDEKLGDPAHPIFAFGGVACVSDQLDAIGAKWRAMKAANFPQVRGALHAKTHLKDSRLKGVKREAVLAAMSEPGLARFGFVLTNRTEVPKSQIMAAATASLTMRFDAIANGMLSKGLWNAPGDVLMIFEESKRLDEAIQAHLGQMSYTLGGQKYPIEGAFMPKRVADPMMEMADFIACTIGRNVKFQLANGKRNCTPNFEALFRNGDRALTSYMEAETITFQLASM